MTEAERDQLNALVDWMRTRGVVRLTTGSQSVELGPEPSPAPVNVAYSREDAEAIEKAAKAKARAEHDRILYGASEGLE